MILDFFSVWYFHKDSDDSDSDDKKKKKGATPPVLAWRPLYYRDAPCVTVTPPVLCTLNDITVAPKATANYYVYSRSSDSSDFFNVELS